MTAEIAIMNREAVALASDSAATVQAGPDQKKIFLSVNKLFRLSKKYPVGIMIYGNASCMGIPWETIVKLFRNELDHTSSPKLEGYASEFLKYLKKNSHLVNAKDQEGFVTSGITGFYQGIILERIRSAVQKRLDNLEDKGKKVECTEAPNRVCHLKEVIPEKEMNEITSKVINDCYQTFENSKRFDELPKTHDKDIRKEYGKLIDKIKKQVFEKLPLSKESSKKLSDIAINLFTKNPEGLSSSNLSGIVIAGFGEDEIFPSVQQLEIYGMVLNRPLFIKKPINRIGIDHSSLIMPFAQREMVSTFMEGIDPEYRMLELNYLGEAFEQLAKKIPEGIKEFDDVKKEKLENQLIEYAKEILKEFDENMNKIRNEFFVSPVTKLVTIAPKEELATMAEALVNLTSFKRKVTMDAETVAGPIDVAVISKGDGFIWIKRKKYYKKELNIHQEEI